MSPIALPTLLSQILSSQNLSVDARAKTQFLRANCWKHSAVRAIRPACAKYRLTVIQGSVLYRNASLETIRAFWGLRGDSSAYQMNTVADV
ncbi:hypothetical protein N7539_006530 [Penicillium diatomitis]|uniref:Uncharacterized protein n=1 Tax=Penicillium diatomitis TaxID=2819901 RepID=A0A9X0BTG5_9EURO|nr:uncharacterized protein N7539_006530 [Penicillium diatomitis]KAJ5483084.1 hypothetical protein N7539_006530 [Penicillium diatomitis]